MKVSLIKIFVGLFTISTLSIFLESCAQATTCGQTRSQSRRTAKRVGKVAPMMRFKK